MNTTTPVIENLKVEEATINLSADLTLASVPVTVSGQYNIHTNCYYPSHVIVAMPIANDEGDLVNDFDLESFCDMMGWDFYETHDAIQSAVEGRDQ